MPTPSTIAPFDAAHLDAVVDLSLRAWAPVFASLQSVMSAEIYQQLVPDWRTSQAQAVADVCQSEDNHVWVALEEQVVAGFVAVKLNRESSMGEIYMIAVDPDFQRRGIGAALTTFVLEWMKEQGMAIAMVDTGGDPGHAPARRTYEQQGFELLSIARYFKKL